MKLLNVRQSNFELLRLLCIFGIVSMHTYGVFCDSAVGINLVLGVLINSIFNTGVSIFILISGYFGVIFTVKKYLKLELEVLFYSILSMVAISIINSSWDIQNIKKAFLPVATGKYWYITSYMMLIAFSEYINKVPEKLDKKKYEKLILLMLFIFSIIPTVVGYHVMNDSGKGFANMLLMYFIGRYIRLYWDEKNNIRFAVVGLCALSVGFVLNLIQSMSRGVGLVAPFARDYSIIIVVASVGIFMLFKQFVFYSNIINSLAKHVVGVYLFEGAVRQQ